MVPRRAVILAAGRGSRLGELTAHRPKPLLEVAGQTVIERVIGSLARSGVREVTVVTGYMASLVEAELAQGARLPMAFARQCGPTGTGGALLSARHFVGDQPFILCWGDVVTEPDNYQRVVDAWSSEIAAVIGVNHMEDVSAGSAVVFGDDKVIIRIVEKPASPAPSQWNSAGVMALSPAIWRHVEALRPSPRGELELTYAISDLVAGGGLARAVEFAGRWFDIGTPDALAAANAAFRS